MSKSTNNVPNRVPEQEKLKFAKQMIGYVALYVFVITIISAIFPSNDVLSETVDLSRTIYTGLFSGSVVYYFFSKK